MTLKGHCLCKKVTYTVDVDKPILTGYDHCDDCQRQSGSTYCKFGIIASLFHLPPIPSTLPHPTTTPQSNNPVVTTTIS
jgi:hypothetical protein